MPIIAREVNHHEWWLKSQQIVEWNKFWNLLILRDKSLNLKKIMVGSCYEMVGYLHHPILSWWKGHPFDLLPSKYQVVETCKSYNRKLQDMKNVMWPWFSNENCCEYHFKQILRGIVNNNLMVCQPYPERPLGLLILPISFSHLSTDNQPIVGFKNVKEGEYCWLCSHTIA